MKNRLRLMTVTVAACGGLAGAVMAEDPSSALVTGVPEVALPALPETLEPVSAARPSSIPEPVSLAVFGTGILLLLRRRRS